MLRAGMSFDLAHGTKIHADMNRKFHNEVGQVNVTVTPEPGWIFAKQRHEADHPLEEAARKNLIVEGTRFERRTRFGVEGGVVRFFEGKRCRTMSMDVVRMFISTDRIEGENDIGLEIGR